MIKIFFYQNVVRADIFPILWQFLRTRRARECGRAANYGGLFSPPAAAKNVRANLRIVHLRNMISRQKLEKLYRSNFSMMEIAEKTHLSYHQVVYWMKNYNISRRTRSEANYLKYNPKRINLV